jgi:uncharacterized protein DUF3105
MGQGGRKGAALLLALVAMLLPVTGCGGGGDDSGSDAAHVNESSGSTHDLPLDERVGTPPPPVHDTDLPKIAREAGCFLFPQLKEEGHRHLPPGSPTPEFHGLAPTDGIPSSGDHVEPPYQQADGAYLVTPEPIDYLASLDRGRMTIQYAPDLAEKLQLEVKGLYDTMYGGTLLYPNDVMSYAVAATTWRALLGCTTWSDEKTLDAVRAFGKAYWGKHGHEPLDPSSVSGPTPRKPAETGGS